MYYCSVYNSPVGKLTIASNEDSIVGLWIDKQRYYMDVLSGKDYKEQETRAIYLAKNWLDKYFNNKRPETSELPIEFIGSDFCKQVWEILTEIPYGSVITYGDIANRLAAKRGIKTMSAQAVGGAVGRNPISVIVPCHRVIGANGSLTGYSGGLEIKKKLLDHEGVKLSAQPNN